MLSDEKITELHLVFDEMFGFQAFTGQKRAFPPIRTTLSSQHASKSAFEQEDAFVEAALGHTQALIFLMSNGAEDSEDHHKMMADGIDDMGFHSVRRTKVDTTMDLMKQAVFHVGLFNGSRHVIFELQQALEQRQSELFNQREAFWSDASRPPNHHARDIALRVARVYVDELGQLPTSGTSRDGGHPSTRFTRALEKIFAILEINAKPRSPANWAIARLKQEQKPNSSDAV